MNDPRRILIVNPFGIGDVLFSTPLIRAVRRAFPEAYLAYLCNRRTEEILRRNPHLNELFIYEKDELVALWKWSKRSALAAVVSLLRGIRRKRFEVAIDLSLGERYSWFLFLLGVPRRIGFEFRRRGRFLTHRSVIEGYFGQHVVEYYAQFLRQVGVIMLEREMELPTSERDRDVAERELAQYGVQRGQRVVGLIPAGGISWGGHAHFRRWPKEGYVRVGTTLRDRYGATILIFGEPADRDICTEIAGAIGASAVNLVGQTTLGQFVNLVGRCDLVVSSDGGPVHIAASQGVRTVSIFGPVDPDVYGPYPRSAQHQVVHRDDLPCRPCYHRFRLPPCPYERACLRELDPDLVLSACEASLEAACATPSLR